MIKKNTINVGNDMVWNILSRTVSWATVNISNDFQTGSDNGVENTHRHRQWRIICIWKPEFEKADIIKVSFWAFVRRGLRAPSLLYTNTQGRKWEFGDMTE